MGKLKIAGYWASSCGGCEIATLEIGEKIVELAQVADIVFWPALVDFKYQDVEKMPDKSIDVCLFNGAIQTSDNEHLAKLMRAKSKVLVAYGSCAYEGCIPGLANMSNREGVFQRVYFDTESTVNPNKILPQTSCKVPEGELELPEFYDTVRTLAQTVEVDYFVPGCPPVGKQTWAVLEAIIQGKLPPPGSVVGAGRQILCEECPRTREEKKLKAIYRPHEIIADPEKCLLEQGLLCAGIATREGCGALCPKAGMPCTGCYGPPEGVNDQGARFLSAVASIIDSDDPVEINRILDSIRDPVGTFYRYSLPNSILKRSVIR
ncbi:MAG: oxidoreductase [Dehalococcoidia bacterium]|nr:oxidoreductase [Dehalococcoidia bacterium]